MDKLAALPEAGEISPLLAFRVGTLRLSSGQALSKTGKVRQPQLWYHRKIQGELIWRAGISDSRPSQRTRRTGHPLFGNNDGIKSLALLLQGSGPVEDDFLRMRLASAEGLERGKTFAGRG